MAVLLQLSHFIQCLLRSRTSATSSRSSQSYFARRPASIDPHRTRTLYGHVTAGKPPNSPAFPTPRPTHQPHAVGKLQTAGRRATRRSRPTGSASDERLDLVEVPVVHRARRSRRRSRSSSWKSITTPIASSCRRRDRDPHAPVVPVQRLERAVVQPELVGGGEVAGGGDLEGHGGHCIHVACACCCPRQPRAPAAVSRAARPPRYARRSAPIATREALRMIAADVRDRPDLRQPHRRPRHGEVDRRADRRAAAARGVRPAARLRRARQRRGDAADRQTSAAAIAIGGDGTLRGVARRLCRSSTASDMPAAAGRPAGHRQPDGPAPRHAGTTRELHAQVAAAIAGEHDRPPRRRPRERRAVPADGRRRVRRARSSTSSTASARGRSTSTSYVLPAALALRAYSYPPLTVTVDGKTVCRDLPGVAFVGNIEGVRHRLPDPAARAAGRRAARRLRAPLPHPQRARPTVPPRRRRASTCTRKASSTSRASTSASSRPSRCRCRSTATPPATRRSRSTCFPSGCLLSCRRSDSQ